MARLSDAMETREIRRYTIDSCTTESSLDAGCSYSMKIFLVLQTNFDFFQIVLFNNADGKYEASFKSNVVVYHNGDMNWVPPAIYKSSCHIDVKYFPFDEQICELRFGSWTYNQHQLNFTYYDEIERNVTIKDYVVSGSWDLMAGPMSIQNPVNDSDLLYARSYRHDRVEFVCRFVIRRKTLFYTVNLIIPTVEFLLTIQTIIFLIFSLFSGAYFISLGLCFLSSN